MEEFVKKVVPYSYRDTDALEAWLEELASERLVLERDWLWGLVFRRTEPTKLRFRIDNTKGANLEQNKHRREQLAEQGWQYVTHYSGKMSIYKNEDLSYWELPKWEELLKRSPFREFSNLVFIIVAYILLILIIGRNYIFGGSILEFIREDFYQLPFMLVLTLFMILGVVQEAIQIKRIKIRKEDGSFTKRSYHTKERVRRGSRRAVLGIVLCFVMPIMVTFSSNMNDRWEFIPIQNYQKVLPVPQLSELVKEENSKRNESQMPELTEGTNFARNEVVENSYFLMPREVMLYQGEEFYYPPQENEKTKSTYYDPFYYELRTEDLARKVLEELRKEYPYRERPANGGVQAYYFQNAQNNSFPGQALLIRYDNKIVRVYYQGEMDLRQYVSLFARYLGAEERLALQGEESQEGIGRLA